MKLSDEARAVLETSMRMNKIGKVESEEIEEVIRALPDDRVLLYKNVISNPIGDLPRYSIHIRLQHMLTFVTFLALAFTGLPIAFYDHFWAEPMNDLIGGVDQLDEFKRVVSTNTSSQFACCWIRRMVHDLADSQEIL